MVDLQKWSYFHYLWSWLRRGNLAEAEDFLREGVWERDRGTGVIEEDEVEGVLEEISGLVVMIDERVFLCKYSIWF